MYQIQGIKLATCCSAIKYKNRDDLLLVKFDNPASVAGVFTQSSFPAASVKLCKKNLKNNKNPEALALIVNSGNANSFTGKKGEETVQLIMDQLSQSLNIDKKTIFTSSTGVIGEQLDYKKINNNIPLLINNLSNHTELWSKAAAAIMTTDLTLKHCSIETEIDGSKIKINGIAKGSGMIAPNMATMLCYIFTDASIDSKILQEILEDVVQRTFNAITVDGDQSTNDTVMVFATNKANNNKIHDSNCKKLGKFKEALEKLMLILAQKIVVDGEGATKLIEIKVTGAKSYKSAKNIAFLIANSPLVKTAISGSDPNWGRIIMAIGKSQEKINEKNLNINIGSFKIIENGKLHENYNENDVHKYLKSDNIVINIDIGFKTNNNFTAWGCDLSEEYVKINKDYRS